MDIDRALEISLPIRLYAKGDRHSVRRQGLNSTRSICQPRVALQIRLADRRTKLRPRARNQGIFPVETTHLEKRFQAHLSNQTSRGCASPAIANSARSQHFPTTKFRDAVPLFQMAE